MAIDARCDGIVDLRVHNWPAVRSTRVRICVSTRQSGGNASDNACDQVVNHCDYGCSINCQTTKSALASPRM